MMIFNTTPIKSNPNLMKKLFILFAITTTIATTAQSVAINTTGSAAHSSAVLDVSSTTKGFLPPRMTREQRIAITNPAVGLQVWCTDCATSGEAQVYNGTTWTNMIGGTASTSVPGAPTNAVATVGTTQQATVSFTAPASNGGGVITSYTVTSSPGNISVSGASSPITVTGLTNGTSYTFTVVATNAAGNSVPSSATAAVTAVYLCDTSITFTYFGASVTYGIVTRAYGGAMGTKCWLDRNLGATQVATSTTDTNAYGHIFQWGRNADGHQLRNAGNVAGTSSSITPGSNALNGGFSSVDPPCCWSNWYIGTDPAPDSLWQGVNGINNPCPTGFRLPTEAEFQAEISTSPWAVGMPQGAFDSPLKFILAGNRFPSTGGVEGMTYNGNYWTSNTVTGGNAKKLYFDIYGNVTITQVQRNGGASVRCIKD